MTLGERLKEYRQREGLSQEQLAEKLCVSRQAITKWENDKGVPDIDNLIAIRRILGISLDELVMGEERIKDTAVKSRENNKVLHLVAAVSFSVAFICWFIAGCLNLEHHNASATVLNFASAFLSLIAATFQVKKYFDLKEQGK